MSDVIEVSGQYYIRAHASIADTGNRVLKYADTFAIFDRHGDIRPLGFENQGVFHEGTRFISRWKLGLNGTSPLLLSSNVKEDNDFLVVDMTNPVLRLGNDRQLPHGVIHLTRTSFLWEGDFFERIAISNFALHPVSLALELSFDADYVDLFEVRGTSRKKRGQLLTPVVTPTDVVLAYEGLDRVVRKTVFHFSEPAQKITEGRALFFFELQAKEEKCLESKASCVVQRKRLDSSFPGALEKVQAAYEDYCKDITLIETSNPQFNDWIHQSRADLHLLLTPTSFGPYPYAGIPWFSCIFGRDGIVTALETLWLQPEIARAVLGYLAKWQATETNEAQDAEPGKILHEQRKGEMAALKEVPFGCYYGSIDSTPLWLILAGYYYERTGDKEFISQLWPHIERALSWIDCEGDRDGDGFVEYRQRASGGLTNQGWKDSEDAVFHADGSLPVAPIALCEVQGYVYLAKLKAARLAEVLGHIERAKQLRKASQDLREHFNEAFWCDDLGTYAIALDGKKKPCRVRSSNAGQCLFSGIADTEKAARIKDGLFTESFFSGWGVRTLANTEARYNPMSYHNGSVWPHDNALIAFGLAQYGFKQEAMRILSALFDASLCMELNRLPELYCGFKRRRGEGPTLYPVACNPQAWSSASVFFLLQACLGLHIDNSPPRLCLDNPDLPGCVERLEIHNLKIGSGVVDVSVIRHRQDVGVNVRHVAGKAEVVVIH
ncbi:MAG TPA: amylo-alpha-1,6-glucosidase [Patescibacteria group bacterium]|nr:amylo-alpha-1,6-glucosidase [Patescibacteria group bacterium]